MNLKCPRCDSELSRHQCADGSDATIDVGAMTICVYCLCIGVVELTKNTNVAYLRHAERDDIRNMDTESYNDLCAAMGYVHQLKTKREESLRNKLKVVN